MTSTTYYRQQRSMDQRYKLNLIGMLSPKRMSAELVCTSNQGTLLIENKKNEGFK